MQEKAGREAGGDTKRLIFCSGREQEQIAGSGCGRHLPQKQHEKGSFKNSSGHVSFKLSCRDELTTFLSLPEKLREILPVARDLNIRHLYL